MLNSPSAPALVVVSFIETAVMFCIYVCTRQGFLRWVPTSLSSGAIFNGIQSMRKTAILSGGPVAHKAAAPSSVSEKFVTSSIMEGDDNNQMRK